LASTYSSLSALPTRHGPNYLKRFFPLLHCFRQRGVRRFVREIFTTSEEPQEGSALLSYVITSRPLQGGIACLQRIQDEALRGPSFDVKLDLAIDPRQGSKVERKHNADHWSV
jgi:hypothetical protein